VEAAAELPPLLCFDEIQTGVGRTGSFFAFEQLGVRPDLATLAKGLANGLPIGVLLVSDEVAGAFSPGDHGSTFGGNPVSCAAACAVLDVIDDALLADVQARGAALIGGLESLPGIRDVRGRGLLIGALVDRSSGEIVAECRDRGLLVLSAGDDVVRVTPPLTIGDSDVAKALEILSDVLM
jgi:acetylornithine/N-succinyldiaminopimelate aminotransferase